MTPKKIDEKKIRWNGGRYGECPYITLGDRKFFIADRKGASGRWEYALMMKKLGEGFDYEFRRKLSDWDYGELLRAKKVFERWYRIKFKSKPLAVEHDSKSTRYERGHLVFWVEKPWGKPPRIICRSTGQLVDGYYSSMKECKHYAERIMRKEIEAYNRSLDEQLTFDI